MPKKPIKKTYLVIGHMCDEDHTMLIVDTNTCHNAKRRFETMVYESYAVKKEDRGTMWNEVYIDFVFCVPLGTKITTLERMYG